MGDWNLPLAHTLYSGDSDAQLSGAPDPMYPQAWGPPSATGSPAGRAVCV